MKSQVSKTIHIKAQTNRFVKLNLKRIFILKITWPDGRLLEHGECVLKSRSCFCRRAGKKANSAAKEINTTNINTKRAAPNLEIGFPLNSLFVKTTNMWPPLSFFRLFQPSPFTPF